MQPTTAPVPGPPAADWAASGVVALSGRPDGPPLVPPGRAATRARELSSTLAAFSERTVTVDGAQLLGERAALTGLRRRGTVSAGGRCRLLRTSDGWAAVSCARPDDPLLLGALIGDDLDAADPWPALADWIRAHRGDELLERAELLGVAAGPVRPDEPAHCPSPMTPRPVEGLLVVDFSALWAGPLCAHLLGLAGARVVKVETPGRPDGARRGGPEFYALLHHDHESVVLDPTERTGRSALRALVDAADIVIEASRPRALAGFGLDAEAAVARGASWVSITAAGRASNRIGFGDDIAAAAGLVAFEPDSGTPAFVGDAIADPLTGLTAAVLAMSAPADGRGVLWDISMTDVVASTLTADPVPRTAQRGDTWFVESENGPIPVAKPLSRKMIGPAAESGADTARVLGSLRIPVP
ncbi:CoA transferase [Nocardia sp. NPDC056541]|uniref:CoA transferase n=1 Tax=Nocardia sp. NPDC056541 TaxID=3345860 RepID=UPI00367223D0